MNTSTNLASSTAKSGVSLSFASAIALSSLKNLSPVSQTAHFPVILQSRLLDCCDRLYEFPETYLTFVAALLEQRSFLSTCVKLSFSSGERCNGSDREIGVQSVTMEAWGPEEDFARWFYHYSRREICQIT